MAVFRVERNKGYTVMSNHHLRNKELSLKAKGLLSQMLSLPDDWDFTLEGLAQINREGIDAIRDGIRELEKVGYVKCSRIRDSKGCLRGTEYIIYEQPTSDHIAISPTLENPTLDKPMLAKPTLGEPILEKPMQSNKDLSITNISNTYSINNQSINLDEMDRCDVEEMITEQIDYEFLLNDCEEAQVKEIISIMADVICSPASTIKINGSQVKKQDVLDRFAQLEDEHIRYIFSSLERNLKNIKNIRAYLITSLYNAPATIDNYYTALFNANNNQANQPERK